MGTGPYSILCYSNNQIQSGHSSLLRAYGVLSITLGEAYEGGQATGKLTVERGTDIRVNTETPSDLSVEVGGGGGAQGPSEAGLQG